MWITKKTVWWIMIYLAFGLGKAHGGLANHHRRRNGAEDHIQNANAEQGGFLTQLEDAVAAAQPSPGRAKREGFVDFDAIPNLMRDFAQNLGRGFNNMVQQGQNLGQRVVHNVMHNMPTIIYGNWKPIHNTKPAYPPDSLYEEPAMQPPPPPQPQTSYVPTPPEINYIEPQFQPIIETAKPIYTSKPVFARPEPVYVKPSPKPTYPIPFDEEDVYGKPLDPVVTPGPPSISPEPVLPAEYSANPDHIHHIAGNTLWYSQLDKMKSKPKMVEGKLENYRPKPGPSLLILRSHK